MVVVVLLALEVENALMVEGGESKLDCSGRTWWLSLIDGIVVVDVAAGRDEIE